MCRLSMKGGKSSVGKRFDDGERCVALLRRKEGAFSRGSKKVERTEIAVIAKIWTGCVAFSSHFLHIYSLLLVVTTSTTKRQNASVNQRVVPVFEFVRCGRCRTIDFSDDRQNA